MSKFIDLTGQRFGKLLVISYFGKKEGHPYWNTKCDCGKKSVVYRGSLRNGDTESCGCLFRLMISKNNTTHGKARTLIYKVWVSMKGRCLNLNDKDYKHYGGRGITICDRWMDFELFYKDMGDPPSRMTLERINTNGNYEPGNCKWATQREQANNKRNNVILSYRGTNLTISQWARRLGIRKDTLRYRILHGWTIQRAFATL